MPEEKLWRRVWSSVILLAGGEETRLTWGGAELDNIASREEVGRAEDVRRQSPAKEGCARRSEKSGAGRKLVSVAYVMQFRTVSQTKETEHQCGVWGGVEKVRVHVAGAKKR